MSIYVVINLYADIFPAPYLFIYHYSSIYIYSLYSEQLKSLRSLFISTARGSISIIYNH